MKWRGIKLIAKIGMALAVLSAAHSAHAKATDKTTALVADKKPVKGKSIAKEKPDGGSGSNVKQDGPLTSEARTNLEHTQETLDQRQQEATSQLGNNGNNQNAGCNGLFCTGSLTNAAQAATAASNLAATAASLQAQAEKRRDELLGQISGGAQQGQYPVQAVGDLQQLFHNSPRPSEEQIQQLHPKIQDGATALSLNQQEIDILKDAQKNFSKTAETARGIEQTLQGRVTNGNTLYPVRAARGAGNAQYPRNSGPILANMRGGSTKENTSSITRRKEEDLPSGQSKRIEAGFAAGGGGAGGSEDTAFGAGASAADSEKKGKGPAGENAPSDKLSPFSAAGNEKKELSAEGKAILAGMLKELKDDIAKGSGKDALAPTMVVTDENGKQVVLDHVPSGSALEGMLLTMDNKGGGRKVASNGAAAIQAGNGALVQYADADFFGINKSLFTRVNEYIRGRGQRDAAFHGR